MGIANPTEDVAAFTHELLRAGDILFGVAADIAEELPADAYPGEEPGAVVIEMLVGTISTAVGDADPGDLRRATELMRAARDRVLEHLRLALELSRRMHGEDGTSRNHG
jgi:hypothetical protein